MHHFTVKAAVLAHFHDLFQPEWQLIALSPWYVIQSFIWFIARLTQHH